MKQGLAIFITAAALLLTISCTKENLIHSCNNNLYSKWQVSTINVKSYVFPMGVVYDTTYNAMQADYIDLSTKGEIDFYINSQSHTDTYDTTQYDLSKDTLVPVNNVDKLGPNYVSIKNINSNTPSLDESNFGIDTKSETIYTLKK